MSNCRNIVYGLVDPRTSLVRYVGRSSNGMQRPKHHRHQLRKDYRSNWIRELKQHGLSYGIAVLEEYTSPDALGEAERWWIAYGRMSGWPLTNLTDGGDGGTPGYRHTEESKKLMSEGKTGKPRPDIALRFAGTHEIPWQCQTPEARAKRIASLTGRKGTRFKHTPEARAKITASKLGKKWTPEMRAKAAATRLANKLAKNRLEHS